MELVVGAARAAGPFDYHRYPAGDVVGGAVLGVQAQLAQVFAMIGGQYYRGVVVYAHIAHRIQQLAQQHVGVAHAAVIAVEYAPELVIGAYTAGVLGIGGVFGVVEHVDLVGAMG